MLVIFCYNFNTQRRGRHHDVVNGKLNDLINRTDPLIIKYPSVIRKLHERISLLVRIDVESIMNIRFTFQTIRPNIPHSDRRDFDKNRLYPPPLSPTPSFRLPKPSPPRSANYYRRDNSDIFTNCFRVIKYLIIPFPDNIKIA